MTLHNIIIIIINLIINIYNNINNHIIVKKNVLWWLYNINIGYI